MIMFNIKCALVYILSIASKEQQVFTAILTWYTQEQRPCKRRKLNCQPSVLSIRCHWACDTLQSAFHSAQDKMLWISVHIYMQSCTELEEQLLSSRTPIPCPRSSSLTYWLQRSWSRLFTFIVQDQGFYHCSCFIFNNSLEGTFALYAPIHPTQLAINRR